MGEPHLSLQLNLGPLGKARKDTKGEAEDPCDEQGDEHEETGLGLRARVSVEAAEGEHHQPGVHQHRDVDDLVEDVGGLSDALDAARQHSSVVAQQLEAVRARLQEVGHEGEERHPGSPK